jgi:hypothetical protein
MSDRSIGANSDRVAEHYESHAGPYGVEMPVPWNIEFIVTPRTNHGEEHFQKSKPVSDKKEDTKGETR